MANNLLSRRVSAVPHGMHSRGITLIELLVTLVIFALLLGMAVPSFTQMVSSSRMTSNTNEFSAALTAARSEAVRRGTAVSLRASNDANPNDFHRGWQSFTDLNADGSAGSTEADGTVLRDNAAITGTTTVRRVIQGGANPNFTYADATSSLTTRQFITFNSRGATTAGGASFFRVCDSARPNNAGRILQVSAVGRVSVFNANANCVP